MAHGVVRRPVGENVRPGHAKVAHGVPREFTSVIQVEGNVGRDHKLMYYEEKTEWMTGGVDKEEIMLMSIAQRDTQLWNSEEVFAAKLCCLVRHVFDNCGR